MHAGLTPPTACLCTPALSGSKAALQRTHLPQISYISIVIIVKNAYLICVVTIYSLQCTLPVDCGYYKTKPLLIRPYSNLMSLMILKYTLHISHIHTVYVYIYFQMKCHV